MGTNMAALGEEYLLTAERLLTRIHQLRAQLKTAPLEQLKSIENRLDVLYCEHAELKKTGTRLINEYGKGDATDGTITAAAG